MEKFIFLPTWTKKDDPNSNCFLCMSRQLRHLWNDFERFLFVGKGMYLKSWSHLKFKEDMYDEYPVLLNFVHYPLPDSKKNMAYTIFM